jgi:hypothetical protein
MKLYNKTERQVFVPSLCEKELKSWIKLWEKQSGSVTDMTNLPNGLIRVVFRTTEMADSFLAQRGGTKDPPTP